MLKRMQCIGACIGAVAMATAAHGEAVCMADGVQSSGSIYRICVPQSDYNGSLVIWCHGFQDATEPVGIPEGQLNFGDVYLPDLITDMGFGFATNSYSKTGLAILQGMDDVLDLVDIYTQEVGAPNKVYLTGASEGGIITTLLVEQYPEIFDGGVAACGPIGDFRYQINYFGDARATFQYFFPGVIPGNPFDPPQWLVDTWSDYYENNVKPVILNPANRSKFDQWVSVAKLPVDPNDYLTSAEICARDVLRYSVVNLKDAAQTLGGFPFGNTSKWYTGSNNDFWLNIFVTRVSADPAAIAEMDNNYDTTGNLEQPLMTLHTTLDQQVPYFHETLYDIKNLIHGDLLTKRLNLRVERFEHCNFTADEALLMFGLLLVYDGDIETILTLFGDIINEDGVITLP